jgi:glycolate oxidase iron-sulfur subunit
MNNSCLKLQREKVIFEIDKCVKCGLCQSVCPLYRELFDEILVARGRMSLIANSLKAQLSSKEEVNFEYSVKLRETIDKCMLCLQCQHNCPQGIDYKGIIVYFRHLVHEKYGYNAAKRFLLKDLLDNNLMKSILTKTSSTLSNLLNIKRKTKTDSQLDYFPMTRIPFIKLPYNNIRSEFPETIVAKDEKHRIALFLGCAIDYFFTNIGKSLIELLPKLKTTVIIPKAQTCCGIPAKVYGDIEASEEMLQKNFTSFEKLDVDAILTLCASCGNELLDSSISNPEYLLITDKIKDFSRYFQNVLFEEYLNLLKAKKPDNIEKLKITYHDPCHLRCGPGVFKEPRKLLGSIPSIDFVEMEKADTCCGLAGTFGINERRISMNIGLEKADNIIKSGVDIVTTSCPACIFQISSALKERSSKVKTLHIVELLNMLIS